MATMAMRPFGYDVEKPMFGSDDLKQRATDLGIRQKPPEGKAARALYEMTQAGASAVNPAAPVRGAIAAAEKTGEAAKRLASDFVQYNRQISVPGASYAVKPRGGTSAYTPDDLNRGRPISDLGKLFQDYQVEARELGASDEIQAFIEAKAPKYFTTAYGTANDPLRLAINSKRVKPFGRDAEKFAPFLDDAAMQGDSQAQLANKIGLEKAYDDTTNMRAYALKPEGSTYKFQDKMFADISEKIGQEGAPIEMRNRPSARDFMQSEFETYPTNSAVLRRLVNNQETLPPNVQQALRTGEPMYDAAPTMELLTPTSVVEALKEIPANKLNNMSFPEALIQGTQALVPVRDYLSAVALAEKGAKVPRQALDKFTTPVMEAPSFGGKWVTIDTSLGTTMEGKLLNHSVGDYHVGGPLYGVDYTGLPYGGKKAFDEGLVRVYSLRDAEGLPKVTVEMAKSNGGKGSMWNVSQIRGRFNSEPLSETREDIFRLLDKVDSQEGLGKVRDNMYMRLPTGESIPYKTVDWADEYNLWKQSAE